MKKIFITGGSSGIGLQIKNKYESMGFVVDNFSRTSGYDLNSNEDIAKIIDAILETDYEIVFLNSGIYSNNLIGEETNNNIEDIININLISNIKIINGIWKKVLHNKVKVVVTLSSASYINGVNESVYNTSKKALKEYIQTANTELRIRKSNNKIFKFVPHFINGTKMTSKENEPSSELKDIIDTLALKINEGAGEFIPKYNEIYKKVFDKYIEDPIGQGIDSYEYRKRRNNE